MKSTYGHAPASTFSAIVMPQETSVLATTAWRSSTASGSTATSASQISRCLSSAWTNGMVRRNRGSLTIELMSLLQSPGETTATDASGPSARVPLPDCDHRLAEGSHQQSVAHARNRNHAPVPDLDLAIRRHAGAEDEPVGQGGNHADAVDVTKTRDLELGHRQRAEAAARVAAIVADSLVERREQPVVRRSEHDQSSVASEVGGGRGHLSAVVANVLEDVEIEDHIELRIARHVGERA